MVRFPQLARTHALAQADEFRTVGMRREVRRVIQEKGTASDGTQLSFNEDVVLERKWKFSYRIHKLHGSQRDF